MGSEREYVLKWHSFSSTIQGVFRRLLENSAFADVTLAVDNETLHCHRLVLSACSTYFENLLTNHPHSHPIIILHDIPHTVLSALVKFMYSGEIRLPQNQLQCFLKVAETLRIKGLTETDGHGGDRVNGGERVLDSSQPPPLIPAAHASASAAAPTPSAPPPPPPRPAAAWVAPMAASKRRTPEPSHERDEAGTPPRDVSSAKRRKSRQPQAVHAVHVNSEPEPESEPEPAPAVESVKEEPGSPELPPQEENGEISDEDEPALTKNEEEEEEEDEEEGEEEEEVVKEEHRLEEDIELVSGDTTEGSPDTPPAPLPTVTQTMQAASEAAASTLINSYGNESPPWKDPRWSSLLPEEKVMEAMGNMLDVPTLAAKLMKNLFTEEERINSNTTGDHGKQIFDKEKMDLIKSIVLHVSKVSEDDQFARDDLWVRCKMKIDKWNRDLRYRYARKKKDKDTSLPTMVKLELAAGRDDDWERERDSRDDLSLDPRWLEAKPFAMQPFPSAAAAPQCSADM